MRNFKSFEIWQDGIKFVTKIFKLTEGFIPSEKFGLVNQLRRASVSIPSNISEGCRGSNKELMYFLRIALGSSYEVETQLIISKNLHMINEDEFQDQMKTIQSLQKRIGAFIQAVKKQPNYNTRN